MITLLRAPLVAAAILLCVYASVPAFAESKSSATVTIGDFSNAGVLTSERWIESVVTINGVPTTIHGSFRTIYGGTTQSTSMSGGTYASLTNNTSSSVTLTPSAKIDVSVNGWTEKTTATATSTIALDTETATGSCSGVVGHYQQTKTVTFTVTNLVPGQSIPKSGSYSGTANNG